MANKSIIQSSKIWGKIYDVLDEVSDEVGEDVVGGGFLLKYEGWGSSCVEELWCKIETEQKKRGIDISSDEAEEEREGVCFVFVEEQSEKMIAFEWKPEMKKRGYCFIDGGYEHGGLYGKTWALFKKKRH
ncbi:MAG: hypothetical protein ABIB93_07665 [Chloroflexota bacterium]